MQRTGSPGSAKIRKYTKQKADTSGVIGTSYTYEPFGAATSSGTTNTNSYQFTGRENDGATGLNFNRARYFSPTFARFISGDPLGFPGGPAVNLYAYVGNNPVSLIDPFGLDPGNGCGFLSLGCIKDFFVYLWNTTSWQLSVCVLVCAGIGHDPYSGLFFTQGC